MGENFLFSLVLTCLIVLTQQRVNIQIIDSKQKEQAQIRGLSFFNKNEYRGQRQLQQKESTDDLKDLIFKQYFSTEMLEEWIDDFIDRCGDIARKFSIGESVKGRKLWVLEISDNPGVVEAEPNVKYIGNIHGNEPSGRQLLPYLAEYLCENHEEDGSDAQRIVRDMHLYLLPAMNPDGFENSLGKEGGQRTNHNGIDLNRNFPDQFQDADMFPTGKILDFEEPETRAVHQWSLDTHFVSSIQFHEGALVLNYPFDGRPDLSEEPEYIAAPDDATFRYIGSKYVATNPLIKDRGGFVGGLTNGAQWYPIYGGMQDWNYLVGKCFEVLVEISGIKTWDPRNLNEFTIEDVLIELWNNNFQSMITYALITAFGGVTGTVTDAATSSPLPGAVISVEGIDWDLPVYNQFGYFSRPLAPGEYTIIASGNGFKNVSKVVQVPEDGSGVKVEFVLERVEVDDSIKIALP